MNAGKNCIVITANKKMDELATLSWKDIHGTRFASDASFALQLKNSDTLYVESVARIIPKRRLVAFGLWQGKQIVAKLFYDSEHASRHSEKDTRGVKVLQDHKVPTPALLYQGATHDGRVQVLIFERILHSDSLNTIWQANKENLQAIVPLLKSVVVELATQHVLGIVQHDLHLDNFLITDKVIYTLDGAQIEIHPELLPKKPSLQNLALFLSQFGVGYELLQELLFRHYARSRGWLLKQSDLKELFFEIRQWNEKRWQRYERKIFRPCTDFACHQDWSSYGMYDRRYATPTLTQFMGDPNAIFSHPSAKMLKAGRSSTVIRIAMDDRDYVIKRYNMKNVWHRLRRTLRPTRAAMSWRLALKLNLFGVRTAAPVAFVENRVFGFRGASYFVSEYIADEHLGAYCKRNRHLPEKINLIVERVALLLQNLAKLNMTHGDLKVTNILINPQEQPVLIDLDGTVEHYSASGLHAAWRKEIKRFLENFAQEPDILTKFKAVFFKTSIDN